MKNGFAHVILILFLIIVVIGAIAFVATGSYISFEPKPTMKPTSSPTSPSVVNKDKQTYVDQKHKFSFDYPQNLKPLELSSGVVMFLPTEDYDACKAARGSEDMQAFEPCYKAVFNLNGFELNSAKSYEIYTKDIKGVAKLQSYTDDKNRVWQTGLVLGEVYNFDAFTTIDHNAVRVSFQYGLNFPSEEIVLSFFNQIISTFKVIK